MMNNNIELRSVGELEGMNFFIPDYQRGYRWTRQQVEDLLDDINEFRGVDGGFYCIQPLVVAKRKDDTFKKIKEEAQNMDDVVRLLKGSWEVVDGQQRLTTIFIILRYLDRAQFYNLAYGTREHLLDNLENKEEAEKDIDLYHMHEALMSVKWWFEEEKKLNDIEKDNYRTKLLNSVKFIWYETLESDAIGVFTRLNIGKISLTNAELIKALLLNSSNFKATDSLATIRPEEIAAEWDNIEYTLQDDSFWLFMHDKTYSQPTRIDYLFDIICQQDSLNKGKASVKRVDESAHKGKDTYKTFRYFYNYFKSDDANVKVCWGVVKGYFQTLQEWYNDLELYHYVGFLVAIKSGGSVIPELLKAWNDASNKSEFVKYLKSEIKRVTIKENNYPLTYQYKDDGSNKGNSRSILLFHNIQTVINQNATLEENAKYKIGIFNKFPFHLYKMENWDVEHINSNTSNELMDEDTRREWLVNIYLSAEEEDREKINDYFKSNDDEQKSQIFAQLLERYQEEDKWDEKEKNQIWNYALLDSSTNRSYGNTIFSGKRRIIIGKDRGEEIAIPQLTAEGIKMGEKSKSTSSFVPICTKQVFLKYYSISYNESNYWTKKDAEKYRTDIEECLKKLDEPIKLSRDEQ